MFKRCGQCRIDRIEHLGGSDQMIVIKKQIDVMPIRVQIVDERVAQHMRRDIHAGIEQGVAAVPEVGMLASNGQNDVGKKMG